MYKLIKTNYLVNKDIIKTYVCYLVSDKYNMNTEKEPDVRKKT